MDFATTTLGDSVIIQIPTRFDFRFVGEFRSRMEAVVDGSGKRVIVDLAETDYLDSSAMGMLLVLRDRARAKGKSVAIVHALGTVRTALNRARFEQIFDLQ